MPAGAAATKPLAVAEQIRFDSLIGELAWGQFHIWDRARSGLIDESEWHRSAAFIGETLATPGGSAWWKANKRQFSNVFQDAINDSISSA
jgi:hypothetical protein